MKKLLAMAVLGLSFSVSCFAQDDKVCNSMTGNYDQAEEACSAADLSAACDKITYDSNPCINACKAGTIGAGNTYCDQIKNPPKTCNATTGNYNDSADACSAQDLEAACRNIGYDSAACPQPASAPSDGSAL